jgi:RNA polymerase sigma-70 factor (ECF subfamily)
VIARGAAGHSWGDHVNDSECQPLPAHAGTPAVEVFPADASERVRALVERHYDFVWRTLQYVGMSATNAEDAAQQVMCVLARRIDAIQPGAESAFLFSTAMRVAAEWRRSARRRPGESEVDLDTLAAEAPTAEELIDRRRARELLAKVLDALPVEMRIPFVLFEIEEMPMPAIAEMLGIPVGTVASRLRRARESFQAIVRRMQAASRTRGEQP